MVGLAGSVWPREGRLRGAKSSLVHSHMTKRGLHVWTGNCRPLRIYPSPDHAKADRHLFK